MFTAPFLASYGDLDAPMQAPFDVAVVIPTILRPSLFHALQSVFRQNFPGRVQVLLGLDVAGDMSVVEAACAHRPPGWLVQAYWPGYSTSVRHGGLCDARDGGVLRCVLSHLANAPLVAYLDDDNWWNADHLSTLRDAIAGADWAFSLRMFVHPTTRQPVCVDQWESVGVGRGIFRERFNGFVDPNCLMIDKRLCASAIACWNIPLQNDPKGMSADRNVFAVLQTLRGVGTGRATSFYVVDPTDGMHPFRLECMGEAWRQAGGLSPVAN